MLSLIKVTVAIVSLYGNKNPNSDNNSGKERTK